MSVPPASSQSAPSPSGMNASLGEMHASPHLQRRRAFLKKLAISLPILGMGSGAGAYGYATLLERHRVKVEKQTIRLDLGEHGPERCRVVTLTDLHFDPLYEVDYLHRCVALANAQQPDIIVLTGDFITHSSARAAQLGEVLSKLKARYGAYACLGNHDHWHQPRRVLTALEKNGIRVLANEHEKVQLPTGELVLAGLQSVWGGRPDWTQASQGLDKDDRVLMLMHEPDYANVLRHDPRIVLQCSGHTHGGQVRVPGWGALILPQFGKLFQAGYYQLGSLNLYVNRGIGTVDEHVRFFCPPEIACLDLENVHS